MAITIYLVLLLFISGAWSEEIKLPLDNKPSQSFSSVFLDFVSWQQEGSIKAGDTRSNIILTNKGICAGGSLGYETIRHRNFIDGCFAYGSANVGSEKSSITYNESGIPIYGLKASVGSGFFVSSAKAEIGFKIPVMYVHQTLTRPSGTSITSPEEFMFMASLYSRWPFQKWFVQTEFSKIIGNDLIFYSLGGGYQF